MADFGDIKNFDYLYDGLKFRPSFKSLQILTKYSSESGIEIHQEYPKKILKGSELSEKLSNNHLLISIARPLLNKVFHFFSNKTNSIMVTDKTAHVIDIVSSPEILLSYFNKGIMLGTCMDYFSFGTNAISMSRYYECPVALLSAEHYCNTLKSFNCIAIPLKIEAKIIGFLDITTLNAEDLIHLSSIAVLLSDLIQLQFSQHSNFKYEKSTPQLNNLNNKEGKIYFLGNILINSNFLFTLKETEILYELYIDKSMHKIATKLCISSNTLKTHMKNIYQKMNVRTLNECLSKINLLL